MSTSYCSFKADDMRDACILSTYRLSSISLLLLCYFVSPVVSYLRHIVKGGRAKYAYAESVADAKVLRGVLPKAFIDLHLVARFMIGCE